MKRYAELRRNLENCGIKTPQDNINWYQEFGTSYQSGKAHLRPGFDAVVAMHIDRIIANNDNAEAIVTKIALEIEHQTRIRSPVDTGNLRNSYRAEKF